MTSLKWFTNQIYPYKARLTQPSQKLKPKRIRLKISEKKRKRMIAKDGRKTQVVALLKLEQIILRSQMAKKRSNIMVLALEKIFLRLFVKSIIRRATTSKIIPSQRTSCNLNNHYNGDCQLGGFIAYILYLVSSPVSKTMRSRPLRFKS